MSHASDYRTSFSEQAEAPVTRVVIDTDDAREGVTGHHVRYVLGISLAAVVVAFALLFATGIV